jgi:capsular polysaccharide transport system permease protein
LDYFTSKIDVTYNQDSQSLDVSAQGVTPKEAQFILQGIINEAQDYVNGVDYQLADKRLQFAQKQVQLAQEKLSDTNEKIINFQNNNDILDPKSDLATYAGILASLQSQLVVAQTELVNLQDYLQNNAPEVDKQKQKIASLQQQIETQKQKILGVDGGRNVKLNAVVNKFEWLRMQAQVAVSEYTAAIASLESAKADAIKQKQQVVILQAPTLPDFHEYPRLWYNTFTLFIILLMIYGIVRMAKTIIDEHRY